VRKDFVKEFGELLKLATPMEHILLASEHPINPGEPGWEERMAGMFKHLWEMTNRRKTWS
jgi:hypothetical protein